MVLGVDGDLYIVADGSGAFAAGSHRTGVGIGQRDLLVGWRPEPSAPLPSRPASAGAGRQSSPSAGPTWPRRYRSLRGRLGPALSGNGGWWRRLARSAR